MRERQKHVCWIRDGSRTLQRFVCQSLALESRAREPAELIETPGTHSISYEDGTSTDRRRRRLIMGSATTQVLSREEARAELESLRRDLGSIDDARERSRAGILPADQEPLLRRADELIWLLGD